MEKKKFAAAALDSEHEILVVYIASLSATFLNSIAFDVVYPFCRPQIAGLIAKKAPTKVSTKYSDFENVFSLYLASQLPKHTGINNYTIKLVNSWQPTYGSIYSLEQVELEIFKAYIETNLADGFIRPSKSPTNTFILFDRNKDKSLQLCVNYKSFNNLTIKNRYLLPLIEELFNRLGRVRRSI